jgi:hypothetical protein
MKENGSWPKDVNFKKCSNNSIEAGPDVKRTNLDLLKFVKSVNLIFLKKQLFCKLYWEHSKIYNYSTAAFQKVTVT